jgi:hypothetical protein
MKIKKQITDNAAKAVRDRVVRYQLDLGLCPYLCEKRDEGSVFRFDEKYEQKRETPSVRSSRSSELL